MSRQLSVLRSALAAALVVVGGAALTTPAASAQGSSTDPAPGFYHPPAELPAAEGALIRAEPFPLAGAVPAIPGAEAVTDHAVPLSTDAHRIMYRSTGAQGRPIAVTGAYLQPRAPWTGPGTRPLVVMAPGTVGQGDACGPSKAFQNLANVQTEPLSVGLGYEIIQAYALLSRGYAVAVTDYEGLGTPGVHTYVHREASARAVLDIARAATAVPGADVGERPRTVFTGYSQGGASAAAAAELHPTHAPDVNLVGTAAGSPPADLLATLEQVDGTAIAGVIGYALNSLAEGQPEIRERLDVHLNDAGQGMLRDTSTQCIGETAFQFGFHTTAQYTRTGRSAIELVREDPVALAVADRQRIGRLAPTTPVRVLSVTNDDVVPGHQSLQLGRDWCAQGAAVQMDVDHTPPVIPGLVVNHGVPMISGLPATLQYLDDRIAGRPAPSNCGTY